MDKYDEEFARRLHEKMRGEKLRVWFAPKDMQGGQKLIEQIDRAIQVNDRLLLVLSEHSLNSEWVRREIQRARATERVEQRQKLFPIRLVSIDRIRDWRCDDADTGEDLAEKIREDHIPDFSNWKNHDALESAFADLHRDPRGATFAVRPVIEQIVAGSTPELTGNQSRFLIRRGLITAAGTLAQ